MKRLFITAGAAVAFYAYFAFSLRDVSSGWSDQAKMAVFSVLLSGGIFAMLWIGGRFREKSQGIRVGVGIVGLLLIIVAAEAMQRWLAYDPVWRKLWDLPWVVVILPLAQGLFGRAKARMENG